MENIEELIQSISKMTGDYRNFPMNISVDRHIAKWIEQFRESKRRDILEAVNYTLERTYFSEGRIRTLVKKIVKSGGKTLLERKRFWESVNFLSIQLGGSSQIDLLEMLNEELLIEYSGFTSQASGNVYLYMDDFIFTGNRVRMDLEEWIKKSAPEACQIIILSLGIHTKGKEYANERINKVIKDVEKSIDVKWVSLMEYEDRMYNSDVLRPSSIPNDQAVQDYVEKMKYKPNLRTGGYQSKSLLFKDNNSRQIMESEFLTLGVKIREMCPLLTDVQRPLGHMTLETLGFGTMIVTYRNCPNNAPLVLWAGSPWYPLFPRVVN